MRDFHPHLVLRCNKRRGSCGEALGGGGAGWREANRVMGTLVIESTIKNKTKRIKK